MKNRTINLGVVAEIANALGDLNEFIVFVGGAVVSVYADDDAADEVRPTQDIDLTLKFFDINQQDLDSSWPTGVFIQISMVMLFAPTNIKI